MIKSSIQYEGRNGGWRVSQYRQQNISKQNEQCKYSTSKESDLLEINGLLKFHVNECVGRQI